MSTDYTETDDAQARVIEEAIDTLIDDATRPDGTIDRDALTRLVKDSVTLVRQTDPDLLASFAEDDEADSDSEAAAANPDADDAPADDSFATPFFTTLREAKDLIDAMKGRPGKEDERREIAEGILADDDLCGQPSDWHSIVCSFLSSGDYRSALRLVLHALERYPFSTDLLADAVRAAAPCGEWDAGEQIIARAQELPMKFWDWYLAVWICNFHLRRAECCHPAERSATIAKGIAIVHDCRAQFPLEERLYNQEAEALLADNRIDEARLVLESAIYHEHEANDGTPCMIPAPQCCLTYLDHILCGVNDYTRIVDIARRGMKSAANTQETVNVGYFAFREALALDSSIHEEDERNHAKGFGNQELVREALAAYALAYQLHRSPSYRAIIRKRFNILCGKSGITDVELVKG